MISKEISRRFYSNEIMNQIESNKSDLTLCIPMMNKDINNSHIIRSANVFNVKQMYLIGNQKILKSASKSGSRPIDTFRVNSYRELFNAIPSNCPKILADSEGSESLFDFNWPENPYLFFGNEGGIPDIVKENADYIVSIPQFGTVNCLNVGVATGIFLFHHRQFLGKKER